MKEEKNRVKGTSTTKQPNDEKATSSQAVQKG
jgi:hypothetical protein